MGLQKRKLWMMMLALTLAGCGDDKKSDDADDCTGDNCLGHGWVAAAAGNKVTVDFSKATAGEQYVLMPYVLNDPKNISGATDASVVFTVATEAGAGAQGGAGLLQSPSSSGTGLAGVPRLMSARERDHNLRTLLNHFDPQRGVDQGAWFWTLARGIDTSDRALAEPSSLRMFAATDGTGAVESFYRTAAKAHHASRARRSMLTADSGKCPDGELSAPNPTNPAVVADLTIPAGAVVDGGDYCIVYISNPVTGGDKATIEATVKEVVKRYKTVIYNDAFAPVSGYTFKPVIAVVDFADTALWPTGDANKSYQVSGAFIGSMSEDAGMPMLYMAADLRKVGSNKGLADKDYNALPNKRLWHGTIAHEMEHAIFNYYRAHVQGGLNDVPAIDEGIAHYMEDLFGHGVDNFDGFAKLFLMNWWDKDLSTPLLDSKESLGIQRGAGQSLIYYLVSQKGGATFTDGVVSGGDGLKYIADIVKNATTAGPENLSAKFGGAWSDTIGNYLGALAIDGSGLAGTDAKYKVQDPEPAKDLLGEDQSYGMHYNNFKDLPPAHTWSEPVKAGALSELRFYATTPLLYTVGDSAGAVTFTTTDTLPNTAVSVVRVK